MAKIIQPTHHAPSHRGSILSIVGVKDGDMYNFKHIEAIVYPNAGPSIRKKYAKPETMYMYLISCLVMSCHMSHIHSLTQTHLLFDKICIIWLELTDKSGCFRLLNIIIHV